MSDSLIRLTDLKNWAYCPRVVFYHRLMPNAAPPTGKMRAGVAAQNLIESLELRRTLERYGWSGARRVPGAWLSDSELGLSGKLDLLLIRDDSRRGAVVDYKLTAGDPGQNHLIQLHGYALLAERRYRIEIDQAFLYRIPDDRVFDIPITAAGKQEVADAVSRINQMVGAESCPDPTPVRNRCVDCEFANYCADIW